MSELAITLAAMRAYGPRSAVLGGGYYRVNNPTIGSGIAMAIQTTLAETNALALLVNANPAVGAGAQDPGAIVVPDYIKLICTVAGATTTDSHFAFALDTGNRYSSGGSLLVPVRTRSGLLVPPTPPTLVKPYFGNLTLTAASGARAFQSHGTVKVAAAPNYVVNDEIIFTFGMMEQGYSILSGTGVQRLYIPVGAVGIEPGDSLALHLWNVANATTAPSFEVEIGYYLQPPSALMVP